MKVLYICTHNRCRSVLSEAITNHLAHGKITAYSAGSQPVGEVHPLTLKYLDQRGVSTEGLRSQSWDDFEDINPDIVITVCDSAASEACPVWFGDTVKVHWGLSDPSKLSGTEADMQAAFYEVMDCIEQRVQKMLQLDLENMSRAQLQNALNTIVEEA